MQLAGSVEIIAMTVPTQLNGNVSVSMYFNRHAEEINVRATQLAHGCGHTQAVIRGDAMISRVIDDEVKDIWCRIDITVEEAAHDAPWVNACRKKNGGGGHGGSGSSVSSSLNSMANGGAKPKPAKKIKPNETCPCGSGKKYKKCHGSSNAPPLPQCVPVPSGR